jgi:hypothetical protein
MSRSIAFAGRASPLGLVLAGLIAVSAPASARRPEEAPPLPPPGAEYSVIQVSSAQALADACWNLGSNQAIVIAPGTYNLAGVNFPNGVDGRLTVGRFGAPAISHIQIRGATGDPADVVIQGAGMLNASVPFGIQIFTASDVLVADLSLRSVYYHAIAVQGDQGAHQVSLYHLRLSDAGQQIIKGVPGSDDVRIEYSELFLSNGAVNHPEGSPPGSCYTNAIDGVGADRWIVRDNLIHDIRCQDLSLAGPSILLWQASTDTVVERNTIINSSRGISLGLVSATDHFNGIVRNNFIRMNPAATYAVDVPIYVTSPGAKVLNNSALTSGRYPNAIEVRYAGATGVTVANNLLDAAIQARDGALPALSNNIVNAQSVWFADPAMGDLHLTAAASSAIGQSTVLADVSDDFDGQSRTIGANLRDIGADEVLPDEIFAHGFE